MGIFTCEICGEIRSGEKAMRDHVNEVHIQGHISCPFCDLSDITAQEMSIHVNENHLKGQDSMDSTEELDCPLCPLKYGDAKVLNTHINSDHFGETPPHSLSEHSHSSVHKCPICSRNDFLSHQDLSIHVNSHLSEDKPSSSKSDYELALKLSQNMDKEVGDFNRLKTEYGMQEEGNFQEQSVSQMERAVCDGDISVMDYYEKRVDLRKSALTGVDDGASVTLDILPTLQKLSSISKDTSKSYFCSSNVDHYGSSFGDKGWGCGYRNLQMLISSLHHQEDTFSKLSQMGLIRSNVPQRLAPSIDTLQKGIERAWSMGFDKMGGEQLGKKLYHTRKWIGATEIVAFLTAHQIRTQIFDFNNPSGSDGTHPVLFQWVLEYFRNPTTIESQFFKDKNGWPFVPPLYLQHQGHSRTIVGVEVLKKNNAIRLLILDPSHSQGQISQGLSPSNSNDTKVLRLIRKNIHSIKSRQYQIVAVTGTYSSEQEASLHKIISSTRIS